MQLSQAISRQGCQGWRRTGNRPGATDETSDSHRITRTLQAQSRVLERVLQAMQAAAEVAKRSMPVSFEITLIDNSNSSSICSQIECWLNDLRPRLPDWSVSLVRAAGNIGYGSGNNLAIDKSNSDYHIVINPDVFVEADALAQCLHFMEADPGVGLLSPAVLAKMASDIFCASAIQRSS